MDGNICRFIPCDAEGDALRILYYVLETGQPDGRMRVPSVYTLHYVAGGKATLATAARTCALGEGDLFFTLPGAPYALREASGLREVYISFLGGRALAMLDALGVHAGRCVFPGYGQLGELFTAGLGVGEAALPWRAEAVLLYALSEIGKSLAHSAPKPPAREAAPLLRKYVDEHFSDPGLTLTAAARALCYNPKYLSALFARAFRVSFSEYLCAVRVQHACALMEQGFTCVRDIAALCGFGDPLYFSRVFKARMGVSPRVHMSEILARKKQAT